MIKVIVFDFAGVVIIHPLRSWFEKHNLDKNIYRNITKKWDTGEIDEDESFTYLSTHAGIPKDKIYVTIFKQVIFKHDTIEVIKKLKKTYKIVLFSNNISSIVKRMLKENNLLNLFDEIIISSDHGLVKPDKAYYQKMLTILNVNPSEVIFTDDQQESVDAGNELGIQSFLFTNAKDLEKDLRSVGIQI